MQSMHTSEQSLEKYYQEDRRDRDYLGERLKSTIRNPQRVLGADARANRLPPFDHRLNIYVPEEKAHLYPWLLKTAYRMIGLSEEEASALAQHNSVHESQHMAAMPRDKKRWYGMRFLAIMKPNELGEVVFDHHSVQPFAYIDEAETLTNQEVASIASAPTNLSRGDLQRVAS